MRGSVSSRENPVRPRSVAPVLIGPPSRFRRYCYVVDVVTATGILNDARSAVASGRGLGGTGFWRLVTAIKNDPDLERFADDVAEVDRKALLDWAILVVPIRPGTVLAVAVMLAGLALLGVAAAVGGHWGGFWLLVSAGFLLATTHGLGHLTVGRAVGIRFAFWYVGEVTRPQPGVKIDYSTYLRTDPTRRAWMHASGAIATKLVVAVLILAAVIADLPAWTQVTMLVLGVATALADVFWSTKSSDWKKFRRELSFRV